MSVANLAVMVAIAAVALVLFMGLFNMMRGGSPSRSQTLMRMRVLLQFVAIVVIMIVVWRSTHDEGHAVVALNRIYTRAGDGGRTQLVGGERRPKNDARIETFGTVDEVNATVGLARLHLGDDAATDAMLGRIQNDLFDLGADLATPASDEPSRRESLRVLDTQVERLEAEIDGMNEGLAPLRSFVLPGGTAAAAYLHLARTVCRRAERLVVGLADKPEERVSPVTLKYLNRLSDHLFVAARHVNGRGERDVLWVPGQNR